VVLAWTEPALFLVHYLCHSGAAVLIPVTSCQLGH
jgi:hypothetical protein